MRTPMTKTEGSVEEEGGRPSRSASADSAAGTKPKKRRDSVGDESGEEQQQPRFSPRVGILHSSLFEEEGGSFGLWTFLAFEAFGERHSTGLDDSVPHAIDNFLAVPARFERFMALGLLVCLDTFLDAVTFLPLRASVAAVALAVRGLKKANGASAQRPNATRVLDSLSSKGPHFNRGRAYDLMRFATVLMCKETLRLVPMSRVYHWIRSQNTIKLYVIVGIMEVFDRLACAFGQDALDSFYLTTRRYETLKDARRVLLFLLVVNGVVLLHASLLYVHITTLNVVVNASEDSAIIALLVSNNFSEIKSFVFKKYNARNLFDVACSDVCERFKLCLFLSLLALLAWTRREDVTNVCTQAAVILFFELIADWVKHAFMAKFNTLDATIYDGYADRLARDVVTGRGGGLALDHAHAVTRRLGLAVLPLACVAARYLSISAGWLRASLDLSNLALSLVLATFALCVFLLKILTSICLAGVAVEHTRRYNEKKEEKINAAKHQPSSFDDNSVPTHSSIIASPDSPSSRRRNISKSLTNINEVATFRIPTNTAALATTATTTNANKNPASPPLPPPRTSDDQSAANMRRPSSKSLDDKAGDPQG